MLDDEWIFYENRPEWRDITPVAQDDGPYSVVLIAYKKKFRDVYDYFRAVVKANELSERAFQLTEDALSMNTGNYSVWLYRRKIIKHLGKNLQDELKYTEKMMQSSEKCYQVWHHRQVIVEWAQDVSEEDRVTKFFLERDHKNYHAWQYRQWYIRTFRLYDGEMEFVDGMIKRDIRNNSAWNHLYFLVKNVNDNLWTAELIESQVEYVLPLMSSVTRNESTWNYLRGILFHAEEDSSIHAKVLQFCESLYAKGDRSPFLLAFLVDLCIDSIARKDSPPELNAERGLQLCDTLGQEVDKIRCNYWEYMKNVIKSKARINGSSGAEAPNQ